MVFSVDLINSIAVKFRDAIEEVKRLGEFWQSGTREIDRMEYFPDGCCDDATDLFAFYLLEEFGIKSEQENGVFFSDNFYEKTNHVWLSFFETDLIVDLTYDQFKEYHHDDRKIYVGSKSEFHLQADEIRKDKNCNISQNTRLLYDYRKIVDKLKSLS